MMVDQETREELNRLYWESDESVADIADRMDISRRALYDSIEPRPAGVPCPECGTPLGFRNRMALENREAGCPACGHEGTVEPPDVVEASEPETGPPPPAPARRAAPWDADSSGPVLGTALVAGLGLGALIAYLLKRR